MVFAFILNRVIKESPNLQNSADINVFLHIDTCHLSWGGVKRLFWSWSFKTCGFETYGPAAAAAAAASLQSCPTLCNPIDSSPPGFPVPGILQARTLEWVAISSSNAWKRKVKVKSLSRVQLLATPWTADYQAPPSMGFSRQEYWGGVPLPSPYGPASSKQRVK